MEKIIIIVGCNCREQVDPIEKIAALGKQLENLVNGAHANGRVIRLFANPDTPEYWRAAKAAGVDFINTDNLEGLAQVFAE